MVKNYTSRARTKTRLILPAVTVSIASTLAILARVCYILYNGDRDIEGDFLGFRWLSSFLYSFGVEVAFVVVGMVINYSTRFMWKDARRPFRLFGWLIQAVGFYFIFWIFIDGSAFTDNVEMAFSACFAISAILLEMTLAKFFKDQIDRLRSIIRRLNDVIILEVPDHVRDIEVYQEEIMWPVLKEVSDEI